MVVFTQRIHFHSNQIHKGINSQSSTLYNDCLETVRWSKMKENSFFIYLVSSIKVDYFCLVATTIKSSIGDIKKS